MNPRGAARPGPAAPARGGRTRCGQAGGPGAAPPPAARVVSSAPVAWRALSGLLALAGLIELKALATLTTLWALWALWALTALTTLTTLRALRALRALWVLATLTVLRSLRALIELTALRAWTPLRARTALTAPIDPTALSAVTTPTLRTALLAPSAPTTRRARTAAPAPALRASALALMAFAGLLALPAPALAAPPPAPPPVRPQAAAPPEPRPAHPAAAALPAMDWATLPSASALSRRCDQALAGWRAAEQALMRRLASAPPGRAGAPPPGARLLDALDHLAHLQEDSLAPLAFLAQVHPRPALRRAAAACELRAQTAQQRLWQQPRLLAALQALQPADPVDAQHRDEALRQAREAGAGLPAAQRPAQARRRLALGRLALDFERHLDDERLRLALPDAAWRGLPPDWVAAQPRAGPGARWLSLDPLRAERFLREAEDRPARAAVWRRWHASGGPANLQRLRQALALRREQARALGAASPAALILAPRMAGSPARAQAFLDRLDAALAPREAAELDALAAWLPEAGGAAGLRRWDLAHAEARAQRASLPPGAAALALPAEAALALAFEAVGQAFGLRFTPQPASLWHPDARAWTVHDLHAPQAPPLGRLFTDLHPRTGKHGHFAVFPLRNAGEGRPAAMALVANLPRQGLGGPELESLFHELGHALQMLLAQPRRLAGAAFAQPWDAVEALPLWLERWATRPEVLALLPRACPACPPPNTAALQALREAPQRLRATRLRRQLQYARYDLALHGPRPEDPLALWRRLEARERFGVLPGDLFPASFRHLMGGYESAYYSYLWSQALAAELDGLVRGSVLDPALGRRLRERWLVHGHDRPAEALWAGLLGRPWSEDALLRSLGPGPAAAPGMLQSPDKP